MSFIGCNGKDFCLALQFNREHGVTHDGGEMAAQDCGLKGTCSLVGNVGEVGAGEGYFTFKLSKRVGSEGKIFAAINNRRFCADCLYL